MTTPRAFLSFDFDHDLTPKTLFAGQAASNSPTSFTIEDWSSKSALPQAVWEQRIRDKIAHTHMLIVLVGRSMGSASGVAKEIAMAKDLNVPVFGVYVDRATATSTLPTGLARNRVVAWSWPTVGSAITQMMGEGKNA
ncbi:TIR-like protein DUF1863 [Rathayibacter sp. PhB151]|uniref:TIR domain-containing protein n=1 Tax=Rathayibacter sp. PhB151 TaxID=2485189 RepID=UPI00106378DC|nr:TIR domain-containing protein [Rathayibacter sp. PhB151]TDX74964.1 TIR-like protein DUF1863 [Rathayibacter sp. PhB151]